MLEKLQIVFLKIDQFAKKVKENQAPVTLGSGEFMITIGIAKPSLSFNTIIETNSDLIWT